jgi:hypothetical protein
MGRLTKEFTSCEYCEDVDCTGYKNSCIHRKVYEKLAHYEDLEEQGRLIELPCKVGDTVYVIDDDYEDMYDLSSQYYFVIECEYELYMITGLGIWVFLTKEEAEVKLARLKEGVE